MSELKFGAKKRRPDFDLSSVLHRYSTTMTLSSELGRSMPECGVANIKENFNSEAAGLSWRSWN